MTKKSIIALIHENLKALNITKNGCANIDSIPDMNWVGYTQVCMREHINGALYRNYRLPLYSKNVTKEMLLAINSELTSKADYYKNKTKC